MNIQSLISIKCILESNKINLKSVNGRVADNPVAGRREKLNNPSDSSLPSNIHKQLPSSLQSSFRKNLNEVFINPDVKSDYKKTAGDVARKLRDTYGMKGPKVRLITGPILDRHKQADQKVSK